MGRLNDVWNKLLVALRIRNPWHNKELLEAIKACQKADLAYLHNLCSHRNTASVKFKEFDHLKADLSDGTVKFK